MPSSSSSCCPCSRLRSPACFAASSATEPAQIVTCAALLIAAALSIFVFVRIGFGPENGKLVVVQLFSWINSGSLDVSWSLRVDTLTAVMLIVVTGVSSMVHVYSVGYMAEDPSIPRFMAYLSLFTFFMLMLVTADNLVQLFFGWEGVGLASYLLIGFWYDRPSANAAAIKAFIVNRVGDFGFALGIFAIWMLSGSIGFEDIFAKAPDMAKMRIHFLWMDLPALETACVLLFVGAMGKSAQLGLHTWLPDAMEGPTPVSALIHAATMVTAGVFMVCRLSPLFELAPDRLGVVTLIGGATAFFAATIGLTQFDIKRVVAYSTCSQLGYMFFAAGVGAYSAAMFHLMTHAFFKALLFLGSGSVITCLHHEQDMRQMGGVKEKAPQTFCLMWIGTLSLSGIGVPFIMGHGVGFSGFISKDAILEASFGAHIQVGFIAYWLGDAGAFMTAFYSTRLMFLTFYGKYRGDHHTWEHAHELPAVMLIPLYVLASRRRFRRHGRLRLVRRRGLGAVLGPFDRREVDRAHHPRHARGARLGQGAAAGHGIGRHRAELHLLLRRAVAARPHGQGVRRDLHLRLQQVVLRRAL